MPSCFLSLFFYLKRFFFILHINSSSSFLLFSHPLPYLSPFSDPTYSSKEVHPLLGSQQSLKCQVEAGSGPSPRIKSEQNIILYYIISYYRNGLQKASSYVRNMSWSQFHPPFHNRSNHITATHIHTV